MWLVLRNLLGFDPERIPEAIPQCVSRFLASHSIRKICGAASSPDVQKTAKLFSSRWFETRDVPGKLVLIEHLPDARQKPRQFLRELGVTFCLVREGDQLLTDQIVKRALCSEPSLDPFRCPTLLDPDLLVAHCTPI